MTAITLTLICGGGDSLRAVQPQVVALRNQLGLRAGVEHSADIDWLHLRLFVSGSMDSFSGDGALANARVMKSRRHASGELTMQQPVWEKGARSTRAFLKRAVRDATRTLCARIERAGLQIDTSGLLRDVDAALAAFMKCTTSKSTTSKLRPSKPTPAKRMPAKSTRAEPTRAKPTRAKRRTPKRPRALKSE